MAPLLPLACPPCPITTDGTDANQPKMVPVEKPSTNQKVLTIASGEGEGIMPAPEQNQICAFPLTGIPSFLYRFL